MRQLEQIESAARSLLSYVEQYGVAANPEIVKAQAQLLVDRLKVLRKAEG